MVYVADQYNDRIQVFRLTQSASGDRGSPVLPDGAQSEPDVVPVPIPTVRWGVFGDCSATGCASPVFNLVLNKPQGVAVDPRPDDAGRRHVFVADDDNHRVLEYLPDGSYVRQIGGYGIGAGQFRFPYDVGIDASATRQLYVADNNNHRVQVFDAATLAFKRAWGGFGADPGQLEFPRALGALADDPIGGVAVTDTAGNRVQTFDALGTLTARWGIAGRGPGYVTRPGGIAVDASGMVHVADTFADRLERLGADGAYRGQTGYISPASGYAAPGSGRGQFDNPAAVAYDPVADRVWVADTGNDRVQELAGDGSWVASFGSAGAAEGQLSAPRGIAIDPRGGVLVADTRNNRIQRLDLATGAWSSVALGATTLRSPAGVAAAADGTVYVADTGNNQVLRIAEGQAKPVTSPPDAPLRGPTGLFLHDNSLYIADTGNSRVLRLDTTSGNWDVLGTAGDHVGQFVAPTGVSTDPRGDTLVVADTGNDRLQRFILAGSPPPPTVRIDANVTGDGRGRVTSDPPGIDCPTDCRQAFSASATVTLTATPAAGSQFAGWDGACSGTDPCQLAVTAPTTVIARLTLPSPAATTPPPSPPRPGTPPSRRSGRIDRTRPRLEQLRLTPAAFRPAHTGSALAPSGQGALLRYSLSEPAQVTLRIQRRTRGARHRGHCLPRTRAPRRARPCTRLVRIPGVIRLTGTRGSNRIRLSGRLAGKPLRPSGYRLVAVAIDAAHNTSRRRSIDFRVLAPSR